MAPELFTVTFIKGVTIQQIKTLIQLVVCQPHQPVKPPAMPTLIEMAWSVMCNVSTSRPF
jgi:hypothetical protein